MDLLAYWRIDNYRRDLDTGASFHFNSKQHRLHTSINLGETLWLFTRVVGASGLSEYRIVAKLVVRSKTINPPSYKYGSFRVWGDLKLSQYYKVARESTQDVFELLRLLPLESGSFAGRDRPGIGHAAQTMRGLKPEASRLLRAFCEQLPLEPRARAVADEEKLERTYLGNAAQMEMLLKDATLGYSDGHRAELLGSYFRDRQLVEEINRLYAGRCQLCGFDSPLIYGVETAEAHHVVYRSRGGPDALDNLVLLCPNHHTVIHRTDATFDYAKLYFIFANGRVEPLCFNRHLKPRVLN